MLLIIAFSTSNAFANPSRQKQKSFFCPAKICSIKLDRNEISQFGIANGSSPESSVKFRVFLNPCAFCRAKQYRQAHLVSHPNTAPHHHYRYKHEQKHEHVQTSHSPPKPKHLYLPMLFVTRQRCPL